MANTLYTYDISSLRAGDVLLSTTQQKPSRIIRKATGSDYSHAMLYVHNTIIHAEGEGVFTTNPQRRMFPSGASIVLRLRDPSAVDLKKVCNFAVSLAGGLYSVPEAVLAAILQRTKTAALSPDQYCSRLVAQAYSHAGIQLVTNPDYCSPGDLLQSPLLEEVQGSIRPAIEGELRIYATRDTLKIHQHHTFLWLRRVRRIAKERGVVVASINDAFDFVLAHPRHDAEVASAIRESGYLDDYLLDCEANPHRYDIESFRAILHAHSPEVERILRDEIQINRDMVANILPHLQKFFGASLAVFQLMFDMHIRRLEQVRERIELIRLLAEENGLESMASEAAAMVCILGQGDNSLRS